MRFDQWIYALPLRLRSVVRRRAVEQELDEELRYHIDRKIEQLVSGGLAPNEARTAAMRALGGIERRKDDCRDTRRVNPIESVTRDVRYALRMLRHNPGFTAVAVLTLMLGLGANTAIFTVVNSVLLRPLAYDAPERLVTVPGTVAAGNFLDWQAGTHSFEQMAAAEYWTPNLTGGDRAEQVNGLRVGADVFPMLGVRPLLGRWLLSDEAHDGRQHVIVLRHDFWQTRFGGDPKVLGRTLMLDGATHTIVGVMPKGFVFAPYWTTQAQLWAPLVLDARRADHVGASLRVFARLRRDATIDQGRADLTAVAARVEREYPGTNGRPTIVPLHQMVVGDVEQALLILLAAVALVLLIGCANVAHLQLMRAAAREREFALRTALGGSRARLFQQSLIESAILSLIGGLLGFGLAVAGVRLLVVLAPPAVPRLDTISIDGTAFLFMLGAALLAGIICGVAPAMAASRADMNRTLKESSRSSADSVRKRRVRGVLVVSEFAMALMLLVGAGLVLKSFAALLAVDAGFDPRSTLSLVVSVRGTADADGPRRAVFFRELVERVSALPGVTAASAINHIPLHGDDWHFPFAIEGQPLARPGENPKAQFLVVHPSYFRTMNIPIRHGRDFTTADGSSNSHLVIISESMARRRWPNESPIGRGLTVDDAATHPDWFTVVGVVGDVRQGAWSRAEVEQMYYPQMAGADQAWDAAHLVTHLNPHAMTLVIRTASSPPGLAPAVMKIVGSMDRDAPVSDILTMEQAIGEQLVEPRFYLLLLGMFAAVAVTLSAVGVYGVISYSVARRTHEIGVRLALGAGRGVAFGLIVRQGMRLAVLGGAVGIAAAAGMTKYLRTLLYGVQPTDPATFAWAALVLGLVALAACCVPARRASRVDPVVALRGE
jgi:predicted permease